MARKKKLVPLSAHELARKFIGFGQTNSKHTGRPVPKEDVLDAYADEGVTPELLEQAWAIAIDDPNARALFDLDDALDEDDEDEDEEDLDDEEEAPEDDDDEPTSDSAAVPADKPVATIAANGGSPTYRPTRYLEHRFTQAEIDAFRADGERLDEQADGVAEHLADREKELKALRADIKDLEAREKELTKQRRELSRRVRFGCEFQNVPCEEHKEPDPREGEPTFGKLMMVTRRCDTGEVLDARELVGAERQGSLFGDAPARTPIGDAVEQRASS